MKTILIQQAPLHNYLPGDAILETERLAAGGFNIMGGGAAGVTPATIGGDDKVPFQPDKNDFKWLSGGLAFLKIGAEDSERLFNAIGTMVNLVGGIISIVGAVGAVIDLMKKTGILTDDAFNSEKALQQIGQRVEQIYGYLAQTERQDLYTKSLAWRIAAAKVRQELTNAALSRTNDNLRTLVDRAAEFDTAILTMLDVGSGRIAFLRAVYGNGSWIAAAESPYMQTAGGVPINYRSPELELQARIWDAGYYYDVLLHALSQRIAVAAALEPAFRSTGYDRQKIADIASGLLTFVHTWRASLLIADPIYAINPGGNMRSPYVQAPFGVPLGAVDPVTGMSSFLPTWSGFAVHAERRQYMPFEAWGGVWDETQAVDGDAAVKAATAEHAAAVDRLVKACGIEPLMRLQRALRELGSPPVGSDFVKLPDAKLRRPWISSAALGMFGRETVDIGEPVTVDLGRLKVFAAEPDRTYQGQRFRQTGEKLFGFRMARRTDWSRIQLGYRLRIGDQSITLVDFSTAPGPGVNVVEFPSAPIERDLVIRTKVYDCYQSAHMSARDEDRFEAQGKVPGTERLFLNERDGEAYVRVTVSFLPFADGAQSGYAGEAQVAISIIDPAMHPDASILKVMVFETHVGYDFAPEEVIADTMTVHVVPSYVVLGQDFFDAYHAAQARMAKAIKGMDERFTKHQVEIGPPSPDPAWSVRERAATVTRQLDALDQLRAVAGEEIDREVAAYLAPTARG